MFFHFNFQSDDAGVDQFDQVVDHFLPFAEPLHESEDFESDQKHEDGQGGQCQQVSYK